MYFIPNVSHRDPCGYVTSGVCAKFKMELNCRQTIETFDMDKREPLRFEIDCLTFILVWISNYILYEMWDEITYPLQNFNAATVEVWEWLSNFIPHLIGHVITYACWD